MERIPVVDMGQLGLSYDMDEACPEEKDRVTSEITHALTDTGFVYLKNHGIPQEEIDAGFRVGKEYFLLPQEEKDKNARIFPSYEGYCGPGTETFVELTRIEMRESYNFTFINDLLPKQYPEFETVYKKLFNRLEELTPRILRIMAKGLGLDEEVFLPFHKDMITKPQNVMRILHYPPLPDDVTNISRLGEHSDYETITFLFQDDVGGLQVKSVDGEWIDAKPIPETILVNVGDLIEIWSGGIFKSTLHRVPVPTCEEKRKQRRYSMTLFVGPDLDTWVEPLVGDKEKYKGTNAKEFVEKKLHDNYKQ